MFAKLSTRDCARCGTGHDLCCARIQLSEGRCCEVCSHELRQVITAEWPDADPPNLPPNRPPRASASDDEELVRALLDRADIDEDSTEIFGGASLSAYRSLAASRGVDLEEVIRHAVRDELRRIVQLPTVQPRTNETSGDDLQ